MFPLIALFCLLCVALSKGQTFPAETSQCIKDTWGFIENAVNKEALTLELPPENIMGAMSLMNGKILSLSPFKWSNFTVKTDNPKNFAIETLVSFKNIAILYKCKLNYKEEERRACRDIDLKMTDLKFWTGLKVDKSSGLLTLDDVKLWTGGFAVEGLGPMYTLINGDKFESVRATLNSYIEELINGREVIIPGEVLFNCK